jgi:YesN/AraC family two-component response regulator
MSVSLNAIKNILGSTYDVRVAKNAKLALVILDTVKVDLLILDIEMPQVSGFDLFNIIRSNDDTKNIPVMFVSSHADSEYITQAASSGVRDYMVKPIVPGKLLKRIGAILNSSPDFATETSPEARTAGGQKRDSQIQKRLLEQLTAMTNASVSGDVGMVEHIIGKLLRQDFGEDINRSISEIDQCIGNFEYSRMIEKADALSASLLAALEAPLSRVNQ